MLGALLVAAGIAGGCGTGRSRAASSAQSVVAARQNCEAGIGSVRRRLAASVPPGGEVRVSVAGVDRGRCSYVMSITRTFGGEVTRRCSPRSYGPDACVRKIWP